MRRAGQVRENAETITAAAEADTETVWRLLRIALRAGQVQTTGHSANAALVELGDQAARVIDRIETARTQRAPRRGAGQEGPPHP